MSKSHVTTEELEELIATLESPEIDDAEELVLWLCTDGIGVLRELVELRQLAAKRLFLLWDIQEETADCGSYSEEIMERIEVLLKEREDLLVAEGSDEDSILALGEEDRGSS